MKSVKVALVLALVAASCWLAACGIGNAVRPDDPRANQAIGEDFVCTPEKLAGNLSPFTVDWSDGDRVALESEMADGVALVRFTCEGVEVLRGCDIPGDYGYKGLSKKTRLVTMSDMASVKANIGGTVNLPSEFKAEMGQGSALNLAYVLVGAESTTVKNVSKAVIQQEHCKAATHFVYEAQIGAFAMETSTHGEVKAAADILGYGNVSGQAGSQKKVRVTDGEPGACDGTSSKDREKTDGCQAMMRVSLLPVSAGAVSASAANADTGTDLSTVDARGCPDGFVYDDGQCKRAGEAKAYLCDEGDMQGCRAQCEAGSVESCGRFSAAFMDTTFGSGLYLIGEENHARFLKEVVPLREKLSSACDELEASACALSALMVDMDALRADEDPSEALVPAYATLVSLACGLGDQRACQAVADIYGDGVYETKGYGADPVALDAILGGACEGGNSRACWLIGELYYFNAGRIERDVNKMVEYLTRACYGDNTMACAFVGLAYNYQDTAACVSKLDSFRPFLKKNFIVNQTSDAEELTEFCEATASLYSDTKAFDVFFSACDDADQAFAKALCDSARLDLGLDGIDLDL